MTIEIQLNDSEAVALQQKAQAVGQDLPAYVSDILRREARRPFRTLRQITEDIEKQRGEPLNMTEDEIAEMLEIAKHEMRAERRLRAAQ